MTFTVTVLPFIASTDAKNTPFLSVYIHTPFDIALPNLTW